MTSRPRTLDQWSRWLELYPQASGESITDWFARVTELANAKAEEPDPPRLPYREPGGDDE